MRTRAQLATAASVLAVGISTLVAGQAAAATAQASAAVHPITGTAGNAGHLVCGASTRTKDLPGSITMVVNHAPTGQLLVRLQDAKNGTYFGEQKLIKVGVTPSTLVTDVLAGTQFHVCAASPNATPGGPYNAQLSY